MRRLDGASQDTDPPDGVQPVDGQVIPPKSRSRWRWPGPRDPARIGAGDVRERGPDDAAVADDQPRARGRSSSTAAPTRVTQVVPGLAARARPAARRATRARCRTGTRSAAGRPSPPRRSHASADRAARRGSRAAPRSPSRAGGRSRARSRTAGGRRRSARASARPASDSGGSAWPWSRPSAL